MVRFRPSWLAQAFAQVGAFVLNAGSKNAVRSSLVFSDAYTARASLAAGALLVEVYDADAAKEASDQDWRPSTSPIPWPNPG